MERSAIANAISSGRLEVAGPRAIEKALGDWLNLGPLTEVATARGLGPRDLVLGSLLLNVYRRRLYIVPFHIELIKSKSISICWDHRLQNPWNLHH